MATLKETAEGFTPKQTLNIADLDIVNVNTEIKEELEVEFPYSYVEVEGQRYRVPTSVVTAIKAILEEKPNLTKIKVKKTGQGMETKYTVIPLD